MHLTLLLRFRSTLETMELRNLCPRDSRRSAIRSACPVGMFKIALVPFAAALASSTPAAFRSSVASAPASAGPASVAAVLSNLQWPSGGPPPDFAVLTVPQEHADSLHSFSDEIARKISARILIGVLGQAIGAGKEFDQEPGLSLIAGTLPVGTAITPFVVSESRMPSLSTFDDGGEDRARPGFLVFADPYSAVSQVASLLNELCPSSVVAGGLSCPISDSSPSLALFENGVCRALPTGSLIGVRLAGPNFEMHSCTAQGAAPVGPSFVVTKGDGNLVTELDGQPALERLQEVARAAAREEGGERVVKLLQRALLVGSSIEIDETDETDETDEVGSAAGADSDGLDDAQGSRRVPVVADGEPDFLIRGVLGADSKGGLYIGDRVTPGKSRVRFHCRDGQAAHEELTVLLQRYRLTRQFSGRFDGERSRPLGCMLFSCNGRGRRMYAPTAGAEVSYTVADHDSTVIREATVRDLPIGGFFCNGELGPLGVKGVSAPLAEGSVNTYLHGFTSVVAFFYDTTER